MMVVLGLDPGMDGAAVLMIPASVGGLVVSRYRLFRDFTIKAPSRGRQYDHSRLARDLAGLAEEARYGELRCVLEQGRGQPGASSSSLAIGVGFGLLLGIIAANQWPVVIVQPATWHRHLFGRGATGEPKARALAFVRDRVPSFDATVGRFRKPHGGLIDATCLAWWGHKHGI